jgi:hypothetical protein
MLPISELPQHLQKMKMRTMTAMIANPINPPDSQFFSILYHPFYFKHIYTILLRIKIFATMKMIKLNLFLKFIRNKTGLIISAYTGKLVDTFLLGRRRIAEVVRAFFYRFFVLSEDFWLSLPAT